MTRFEIASPYWLLLLFALVPVLLLRIRAHLLARKGAPGLVSPRLRHQLITGSSTVWRWLRFALFSFAFAAVTVALARPQWGVEKVETQSHGRNVLIAIDTSRSMLANDVSPSRIDRAKLAAEDIVKALPGDRVGLIAFAGGAFVQAPLTVDHAAVVETLRQFDSELIPRGGTNLGSAVQIAIETFKKADVGESALILFSDGEDLEGGEQLASLRAQATASGMTIVAIAVGTEAGSIIPDPEANEPGIFVKDEAGQIVRSRLNPVALQAISADTENGLYLALDGRRSIASVVAASLSQLELTSGEEVERERPIERFGWFLAIGLLLFAAGWVLPDFRRSRQAASGRRVTANRTSAIPAARRKNGHRPAASPSPAASVPPSLEDVERMKARAGAASVLMIVACCVASYLVGTSSAIAQGSDTEASPQGQSTSATSTANKLRDPELAAREALDAMQDGRFEKAASSYRDAIGEESDAAGRVSRPDPQLNFGLGSAAYKLGDYETAKQAFSRALETADRELATRAQYNLANTLFRHGETFLDESLAQPDKAAAAEQWTSALEHYQGALELDPRNDRARHNADVVSARLELLKKEQRQEQQQQEDEKEDDEKEEEDPPEEEEDDEEEEEDEEEDKDDKEEEQKEDDQEKEQNENGEGENQNDDQGQNNQQNENNSDNSGEDGNQNQNQDQNQDQSKGNDGNSGSDGGQQPPPDGGGDQGSGGENENGQQPPPEGGNDDSKDQQGDQGREDSPPPSGKEGSPPPPSSNSENGNNDPQKGNQSKGPAGQPQSQDSAAPPNSETEEPPEGELEANPPQQSANGQPAQPQNANPQNAQAGNASQQSGERDPNADVMNAQTGYTPSEARRLLRTQSEEALRMLKVRVPQSSDRYRNW